MWIGTDEGRVVWQSELEGWLKHAKRDKNEI